MKKELNYGYQLENGFVIIVPLQGGGSVYVHLDEVLAEIETKVGSLSRKHIICEGHDGFWDLILPAGKGEHKPTSIYPLNSVNLIEAKARFRELVASGKFLE